MKRKYGILMIAVLMAFLLVAYVIPANGISAAQEGQDEIYYGDVDDSGKIDAKDVTALRRYLAGGWNVTINLEKADIDGNGGVDAKDVTMLRRYLAGGWGVNLSSKDINNPEAGEGWKYGDDAGTPYRSSNYGNNNYTISTSTIKSYIYEEDGCYVRAEADNGIIHIEKYDKDFKLLASKNVSYGSEYIWGGMYCGKDDNYVVIGQENDAEDDERMVFRVIKYDKNWDKLSSVDINGAYTTVPFRSGAVRCAEDEESLFVYTTQQRYTSEDGIRHQSRLIIVIDKNKMSVEDLKYAGESKSSKIKDVYTSHCFNNFVLYDSKGNLSFLSQGDAYPRELFISEQTLNMNKRDYYWKGLNLNKNENQYEGVRSNDIQYFANAMYPDDCSFMGSMYWVNETGCSVGGFEETKDGYIVAYNYDENGGQLTPDGQVISINEGSEDCSRNIYIYFVRNNEGIRNGYDGLYQLYNLDYKYKISYEDSPLSGLTPTAVSLGNENGGVVLWQERGPEENICYVRYYPDSTISGVFRVKGLLSDCKPMVSDGKIIWYGTDSEGDVKILEFYSLDVDNNTIITMDWFSKKITIDDSEEYQIPVTRKEILGVDSYMYEEVESKYDNNGGLCEKIYHYCNDHDCMDDSEALAAHVYYDLQGKITRIETPAVWWTDNEKYNVLNIDTDKITLTKHFASHKHVIPVYETIENTFDSDYDLIRRTEVTTDSSGRILEKKVYEYDSDGYNISMHNEGDYYLVNEGRVENEEDFLRNYIQRDEKIEYDENHNIIKTDIVYEEKRNDGLSVYKTHDIETFIDYPKEKSKIINDSEYYNKGIQTYSFHRVDGVIVDGWRRNDHINSSGHEETEIETISNDKVVSTEILEYDYSGTLIHRRVIEEDSIVEEYELSYIYEGDTRKIEEKNIRRLEDGTYDKSVTEKNEDGLVLMIRKGNVLSDYDDYWWTGDDIWEYHYNGNEITESSHTIYKDDNMIYYEKKKYYLGGEQLKEHLVYNSYDEYEKTVIIMYDESGNPTEESDIYLYYNDDTRVEEQYVYTDGEKVLYQTITRDAHGKWTYIKPDSDNH